MPLVPRQAWEYMRSLSSSPSAASEMEVELRAQWAGEEGGLPLGVLQLLRLCLSDRKSRPSMVQVRSRQAGGQCGTHTGAVWHVKIQATTGSGAGREAGWWWGRAGSCTGEPHRCVST